MSVEVSLNHIPVVNFAMQQNHVPVIRELTIRNTGDADLENIEISIEFDPAFADVVTLKVDRLSINTPLRLTDIPVHISTTYMSNLTERITGQMKVTVKSVEETIADESYEISLLAFDQWAGITILPAMLAAFVTPNHPEITSIIRRASEILGKWTGSPSFGEYQTRDPNRVKLQMAAIYEAIAELQITYCTTPASFEEYGQRVRLYGDILSGKLGNCLDMTLLYAGCLEAVGIHPLIVVVKGHAFAGGWLIQESFSDSVNDDVSLLTKRTADGINEILLVEATCMNAGQTATFDQASASANDKLKDSDNFILFIDVLRARNACIRPLPQRVMRGGTYEVEEEKSTGRDASAPSEVSATLSVTDTDHISVGKQTIWERKLLDLSLRNSLLNTRITKNTLQLISADVNVLEDALAAGAEFQIFAKPKDWDNELMSTGIYQSLNASNPITELVKSELKEKRLYSYLTEDALPRALTHLYRSSRLSIEENGANTLYLAVGLLKWFETPSSTRPRFAPILLIPVEIIRKSAAKGYVIRNRDEDTSLNITLLEMLRQDFGISIGGLDPLPTDENGVDVGQVFNVFRRAIMAQTGWDVEEQAVLGNFSFNKFIMWNDIHNNADKLSRNKIVSSLISGRTEWDGDEIGGSDMDPDKDYPAGTVALPIGADSSQFEAICAAVDEKSFILHGPPGTGKSQTITNIIANALYNGKKVLFVAEKMAALQVVQRRLAAIGLGPFCLELHSNKTKKSYILEQLKNTTEVVKQKSNEDFRIKAEQINQLRRELNGYVESLHRIYPAGLSLYDCIARYSAIKCDGVPAELPSETLEKLTPSSTADAETTVAEYQAITILCGDPSRHPLAGIGLSDFSSAIKTEASRCISDLSDDIDRFQSILKEIASTLEFESEALSLGQIKALNEMLRLLTDAKDVPVGLLKSGVNQELAEVIGDAITAGRERDEIRASLLDSFSEDILAWDYAEWESKWRESASKWWLPRVLGESKVKSSIKPYVKAGRKLTPELMEETFGQLQKYHEEKRKVEKSGTELSGLFGRLWMNGEADWDRIETATSDVKTMCRQMVILTGDVAKSARMKDSLCRNLESGIETFRDLHDARLNAARELWDKICTSTAHIVDLLDARLNDGNTLPERKALLDRWADNIDKLHDWAAYNAMRDKVIARGLGSVVKEVEDGRVEIASIRDFFLKSLYRSYAEYILSNEPEMTAFHGTIFEDKIKRFRQFSSEFERLTREELFNKLASALPALQKEASQGSEVGILQRNIRNGGRGTSIRRLFDQIPNLLTRMCPCMLMSPLSVAQYIDAGNSPFDLVIFDEASQMPTSEAVGAIARGKNVVVVGDPKQMPPTNFFASNTFDEDNADKEDMENILEDCLALTMPSKYLLWHYRSRHESLIAFSNVKYYGNKLLTFPSPDDLVTKVGWQHVDGIYDRGKTRQNRAEAEAVVEEIKKRLSDPETAKKSIGVVTFNTNQQSLIEDLLTDFFSHNPELETVAMGLEEPIFIKNLENVQGDERDVILFSIGYGPDKAGNIALNFGPLNRDGGGRRLNVAVSRARYEMKVFSTLKSEQIDLNRTSADGVADLKAFLEYAEKGREFLAATSEKEIKKTDRLVESIAEALRERGYGVRTNVGCSGYRVDIGVVDPDNTDRYIMGILCDGYQYASSKMANDRVVTQDSVLRQLGWRLHRVWSMDWWENREKTIDSIVEAIERDEKQETQDPTIPKQVKQEAEKLQSAPQSPAALDVPSRAVPYAQYEMPVVKMTTDEFASGYFDQKIMSRIAMIIENEAPISKSLLYKKVIDSVGLSRLTPRITSYLDRLMIRAFYKKTGEENLFFWRKDQDPDGYDVYRPDSKRDATDIAPEEYAVALCTILEEQMSLPKDSLKKEVAQTFGFTRVGDNVSAAIERAIEYAIAQGQVVVKDDRLLLNDRG